MKIKEELKMKEMSIEEADKIVSNNKEYQYYMSNVYERCFLNSKLPVAGNCYVIKSNEPIVTLKDIIKNKIDVIKVIDF